jgi:hypothetical protein
LIEKAFEEGRAKLGQHRVPLHSLVVISDMSDGQITFAV